MITSTTAFSHSLRGISTAIACNDLSFRHLAYEERRTFSCLSFTLLSHACTSPCSACSWGLSLHVALRLSLCFPHVSRTNPLAFSSAPSLLARRHALHVNCAFYCIFPCAFLCALLPPISFWNDQAHCFVQATLQVLFPNCWLQCYIHDIQIDIA